MTHSLHQSASALKRVESRWVIERCGMHSFSPHHLDPASAVKNIVEATADDDVLVKGRLRNELRIGLDREGQFLGRFPMRHDLEKGDVSLEGGVAFSSDPLMIDHRGDGTREAEVVDPLIWNLLATDRGDLVDLIPHRLG